MSIDNGTNKKKWSENLPIAPIPELQTTLARYLSGLEAVIPNAQLEQTRQTVKVFLAENGTGSGGGGEDGEGERLQKLLTEYAKQSDNWVTGFWIDDMYLTNPLPLVINSNPFFLLPRQTFKKTSEMIHFASIITHFALNFKEQIDSESLKQDVVRGQKLCMRTYRRFFTACRIPGPEKDELLISKNSQHFIVAAFNQFNVVYLKPGKIPSIQELSKYLLDIWNKSKIKNFSFNLGILTTENRRTWANIRKELLKDKINRESLEKLETCLFVLCLDDFVLPKSCNKTGYRNSIQIAKMDASYMASMLLHGGGSEVHTSNRWFDKFLQVIVSKEGICGLLIEHSASEGITVLNFLEQFLAYYRNSISDQLIQHSIEMENSSNVLFSKTLQWNIDIGMEKYIKQAEKQVDKLISDFDLYVLNFMEFGREFIKQQRISPDVFIQLALQLTYFKLHRRIVSTYESCSLRHFLNGRVDNIRASTIEALKWARSMCPHGGESDGISEDQKIKLFKQAIQKQTEVLKYTSSGFGPDNHLLALKELSKTNFDSIPNLFKEKSFKEYINFRLSTSQLFTNDDILVGYGPVVPDGYGCSYSPKQDNILFCVSSFYSSDETSSDFFALSLEGSLLQMRELCLRMNSA